MMLQQIYMQAAITGDREVLQRAIEFGLLNPQEPFCVYLSCCAAFYGHADLVKYLLKSGVNVNAFDSMGYTALILGAKNGQTTVVAELLNYFPTLVNWRDWYGRTALSWAAQNGHLAAAKLLLGQDDEALLPREDVLVNEPDCNGAAPLHYAVSSQNQAMVEAFLAHPYIAVNQRDGYGMSPLDVAVNLGATDIILSLIRAGARFSGCPILIEGLSVKDWLLNQDINDDAFWKGLCETGQLNDWEVESKLSTANSQFCEYFLPIAIMQEIDRIDSTSKLTPTVGSCSTRMSM